MDATTPLLNVANSHSTRNPKYTGLRAAMYDLEYVLKASPLNFLLVFVPLGLVWGHFQLDHTWTFAFNFLAIIPLAAILANATEELASKAGNTIGGLLNATFGNAVELIVSVIALKNGQVRIVQASFYVG